MKDSKHLFKQGFSKKHKETIYGLPNGVGSQKLIINKTIITPAQCLDFDLADANNGIEVCHLGCLNPNITKFCCDHFDVCGKKK